MTGTEVWAPDRPVATTVTLCVPTRKFVAGNFTEIFPTIIHGKLLETHIDRVRNSILRVHCADISTATVILGKGVERPVEGRRLASTPSTVIVTINLHRHVRTARSPRPSKTVDLDAERAGRATALKGDDTVRVDGEEAHGVAGRCDGVAGGAGCGDVANDTSGVAGWCGQVIGRLVKISRAAEAGTLSGPWVASSLDRNAVHDY